MEKGSSGFSLLTGTLPASRAAPPRRQLPVVWSSPGVTYHPPAWLVRAASSRSNNRLTFDKRGASHSLFYS
jgi:hypothetical protein